MVVSRLRVLEGGRRSTQSSSRITPITLVRLAVERSHGRQPSLKEVLDVEAEPRRA